MGSPIRKPSLEEKHLALDARFRRSCGVRRNWLFDLNAAAQRAAGGIALNRNRRHCCLEFLGAVSKPATRLEELLFEGTIFELALGGFGNSAFERERRTEWAIRVLLPRSRPNGNRLLQAVRAAAEHIERGFERPLDVSYIASETAVHPTTLRRNFRRSTGVSLREYHIRVRVREAIGLFCAGWSDVLAVARQVGYKSEKNFHRAVHKVLRTTPGKLKALPHEELRRMQAACCPRLLKQAARPRDVPAAARPWARRGPRGPVHPARIASSTRQQGWSK